MLSLGHCIELASHVRQHMDCETGIASKAMLLGEMLGVACAEHRAQFDGHTLRAETQARLDAFVERHNRWMDTHMAYLEGRGLLPYARPAGAEGAPHQQALFKPACAGGPAHVAGLCPAQSDHAGGHAAHHAAAAAPDANAFVPPHCGVHGAWPGWVSALPAEGLAPCAAACEARVSISVSAQTHPGVPAAAGRDPLHSLTPPLLYSADGGGLACWFPAAGPDVQHAQAFRQAVGGDAARWLDAAGWDPVCPGGGAGPAFGSIGEARSSGGDLAWAQAILPHAAPALPAPAAAAAHAADWTADGGAAAIPAAAAEPCRKAAPSRLTDWTARRRRRELDDGGDCQRRLKAARG